MTIESPHKSPEPIADATLGLRLSVSAAWLSFGRQAARTYRTMTPDQNVKQWAWVICIATGLGSVVLLYLVYLYMQLGVAGIGGRYGGLSVSRKSQPVQFWSIVGLHILGSFFCAYMTYGMYHKFMT